MIIQELNSIRIYLQNPVAIPLDRITDYLKGGVSEEFFLIEASSSDKAEIIFAQLLDWDAHYFHKKFENIIAAMYSNCEFHALRFLVSVSKTSSKKNFLKLSKQIDYFLQVSKTIDPNKNTQVYWFVAEIIMSFPLDGIKVKHLTFIYSHALLANSSIVSADIKDKLIPKIIEKKDKRLLHAVLDQLVFKFERKNNYLGLQCRFDNYYLSELISEDSVKVFAEIIGKNELIEFSLKKLKKAVSIDQYYFSSGSLASIEDTDQILDLMSLEFSFVRFVRRQLETNLFEDSYIKKELLKAKHPILRRLGIHYINYHYNKKKALFWKLEYNPLNYGDLKHETFILLKSNVLNISGSELKILFAWIDSIKFRKWKTKISKKDLAEIKAVEGKEYLFALNESDEKILNKVKEKKAALDLINKRDREHPGFNTFFSVSTGQPYEIDKREGEARILFENIVAQRIIDQEGFKAIDKIDLQFLSNIIRSYQQKWEARCPIDWKNILTVIEYVLNSGTFSLSKNRDHFLGYCSWFIRSGTENDDNAISGEELIKAKDICLKMLSLNVENELQNKDPLFDILNNTDGKIFDATLNVLLRNARVNTKEDADKWYPDVKAFYDGILESGKLSKAFLWNVAGNFPQFGYLDIVWVRSNINKIFPVDKEIWKFSMLMYHQRIKTVYKDLFNLLMSEGHYDRALQEFIGEEKGIKEISEHIILACLANWQGQELDNTNGLVSKILQKQEINQIKGVINYFLTNRNYNKNKMIDVWEYILNNVDRNVEQVAKELMLLADEIDLFDKRAFTLVNDTLDKITDKGNYFRFVKNLVSSEATDNVSYRAKLLMKAIDENMNKYYFTESIENFAKKVYESDRKLGDELVIDLVGKRGFQLLRVYNEVNQS